MKVFYALVAADPCVAPTLKAAWQQANEKFCAAFQVEPTAPPSVIGGSIHPTTLFQTPPGNQHGGGIDLRSHGAITPATCLAAPPSFLSEIKSRTALSFDDSALFSSEKSHAAARATASASNIVSALYIATTVVTSS